MLKEDWGGGGGGAITVILSVDRVGSQTMFRVSGSTRHVRGHEVINRKLWLSIGQFAG